MSKLVRKDMALSKCFLNKWEPLKQELLLELSSNTTFVKVKEEKEKVK